MRIDLKIAGSSFRGPPAEDKIRKWQAGTACGPVRLELEDGNSHDPNAVKILIDGVQVGYVPRELAPTVRDWLARQMIGELRIVRPWNVSLEILR